MIIGLRVITQGRNLACSLFGMTNGDGILLIDVIFIAQYGLQPGRKKPGLNLKYVSLRV